MSPPASTSALGSGSGSVAPTPRAEVVLVGRPNAGKSSLFNVVSGGHAHVGNFPGITVDILEAEVPLPASAGGGFVELVDLPGLYSIGAVIDPGTDEGVARTFLTQAAESETPLVVVQVVDATRLALALRLTRELAATDTPLLVVATQRDVLEREGRSLDVHTLSEAIGAPVVAVSARAKDAKTLVLEAVVDLLDHPRPPRPQPTWDPGALADRAIKDQSDVSGVSRRRRTATARADQVLLHPVVGPFIFLGLMGLAFAAVFLVADPVTRVIDAGNAFLQARIDALLGEGLFASFLTDGLLGGAGTVLAFMPQIVILTVVMELLEASGYLARGAFLVDRLLRLMGLSGRSFLPLLMSHACAVPAIASTRIIRDPRERLTTILVLPLMTCSARIPTFALVIGTFFAGRSAFFKGGLFVGLYFLGVLGGLVASLVLRRSATKGRSLPLVLEMPAYRAPQGRVVARKAARAAVRFLRDVGTTILAVSAVLWVLLTVPMPGASSHAEVRASSGVVEPEPAIQKSIAASVGRALEPVTRPLGFDWRINVGLIGSFGARELMVGTMGVIFGLEDADDDTASLATRMREAKGHDGGRAYSVPTAMALLVFFVFACQCMSTVAAIRRETKSWRWPLFVIAYTYVLAYGAALVAHGVTSLVT